MMSEIEKPDNIPDDFYWDEEFEVFRNEQGNKAFDKEGGPLVGFANPIFKAKHQNKSGRPTGGRNKSALERAQNLIDDSAELAVSNLVKIASNKWKELGYSGPISATVVANANKTILDKAIAQEKDKLKEEERTEESLEEVYTPAAVVDFSKRK